MYKMLAKHGRNVLGSETFLLLPKESGREPQHSGCIGFVVNKTGLHC